MACRKCNDENAHIARLSPRQTVGHPDFVYVQVEFAPPNWPANKRLASRVIHSLSGVYPKGYGIRQHGARFWVYHEDVALDSRLKPVAETEATENQQAMHDERTATQQKVDAAAAQNQASLKSDELTTEERARLAAETADLDD